MNQPASNYRAILDHVIESGESGRANVLVACAEWIKQKAAQGKLHAEEAQIFLKVLASIRDQSTEEKTRKQADTLADALREVYKVIL